MIAPNAFNAIAAVDGEAIANWGALPEEGARLVLVKDDATAFNRIPMISSQCSQVGVVEWKEGLTPDRFTEPIRVVEQRTPDRDQIELSAREAC